MTKQIIHTNGAPQAIGTYSQAVKVGSTVYLSGQIEQLLQNKEVYFLTGLLILNTFIITC